MAKGDAELREKLAALDNLPPGDAGYQVVRKALLDRKANRVVAKAVRICERERYSQACEELVGIYPWYREKNPTKRDPGCRVKTAILQALYSLDHRVAEFYRSNLDYIQMEPVWGGTEDAAQEIRSIAGKGLAYCNEPGVILKLVELLADAEWQVRVGGVQAIASLRSEAAHAVIRHKALAGDRRAEVTGECCTAILELDPDEGPLFVARFLEDESEIVRELAALALGESRLDQAIQLLIERARESSREAIIRGLAIAHKDEAFEYLYGLLEQDASCAPAVVRSLAVYRYDDSIRDEVEKRIQKLESAAVQTAFQEAWLEE